MAKISIATFDQAEKIEPPAKADGVIETRSFFGGPGDPIHLQCHRLSPCAALTLEGVPTDRLIYVWEGSVEAGGVGLAARSSAVVEFGTSLTLTARDEGATLLAFNVRQRRPGDREGGHIHLLPSENVSRTASFHGSDGIGGGLHADAQCPTCKVWLHEQSYAMADKETAPHSHSEDEIIFVTGGMLRLGNRTYGPGTALAIAANARYGFFSGAGGLQFINFRGSSPTYTSADGSMVLDEAELWRSALGPPVYIAPAQ